MILKYVVSDENSYHTVREILKNEFQISSRLLTKLRSNKKVFLNNENTYFNKTLSIDDIVEINLDFEEDNSNIVPTYIPLDIIYEDAAFLIINKPSRNCCTSILFAL